MRIKGKEYRTIWFENNIVKIIDQTKLPHQFIIKDLKTVKEAINAIKIMEVRGAPLIGATAAYGLVLAVIEYNDQSFLKKSAEDLISSRPTAINLKWAVDRMMNKLSGVNSDKILEIALNEAKDICEEDVKFCENIGLNGLKIIDQTKLPHQFIIKELKTIKDSINAIKVMEVRGAPLIGATAAYGLVLAIIENNDQSFLKKSAEDLIKSRPTAINLKWAVDRMINKLSGVNSEKILNIALNEAKEICEEDIKFCEKIGLNGLKIIEEIYNKKKIQSIF